MTDARLPERWLNDRRLLRLSDGQHRTFTTTLLWSVSNRTDGHLDMEDLRLVVGCDTSPQTSGALVKQGLWEPTDTGWHIVDFAATQTSRGELEVLENVRRRDREKKARQREARRTENAASPGMSPGTVPPVQHRQGKDRQGEAVRDAARPWPPVRAAGGVA